LLGVYNVLANQRRAVEMSSKKVGLEIPEWPEQHEANLLSGKPSERNVREQKRASDKKSITGASV
jgi:hypothetical protein